LADERRVAIACDHGGFALKEALKVALPDVTWLDLGTNSTESVDYPDFAGRLADAIKTGKAARGILICGSGIGISIAANRHAHIRCALVHDVTGARLCRQHNDANVLAMGGRTTGDVVARNASKRSWPRHTRAAVIRSASTSWAPERPTSSSAPNCDRCCAGS
jgi:ribose 5-phosphate isomerase B